jgi:hypothetical protein
MAAGSLRSSLADEVFQLANSFARLGNAKQLEGYLHAVIAGVAAEHARIRGTG